MEFAVRKRTFGYVASLGLATPLDRHARASVMASTVCTHLFLCVLVCGLHNLILSSDTTVNGTLSVDLNQ